MNGDEIDDYEAYNELRMVLESWLGDPTAGPLDPDDLPDYPPVNKVPYQERYSTFAEAAYWLVERPLGEYVDSFDVEAIADEVIAFNDGWDEERGICNLNDQYFYSPVEAEEFWEIVERHDINTSAAGCVAADEASKLLAACNTQTVQAAAGSAATDVQVTPPQRGGNTAGQEMSR